MKKIVYLLALLALLTSLSDQTQHYKITLNPIPTSSRGILGKPMLAFDERVWLLKFSADGSEILSVSDTIDRTPWPPACRWWAE